MFSLAENIRRSWTAGKRNLQRALWR